MFDKVKQLGKLKQLRDQAVKLQKALAQEEIDYEDKGVKVVITGDQNIKSLEIDGEQNQKIVDVLNKALKKSQKVAAKKMQEMGGGLTGLLGG